MKHHAIFSALILGALLLTSGAEAATVNAAFNTANTVPVTAASYTATGNTVNFTLNFAPATGTQLTVVRNPGRAFINGTFGNLAQGQTVALTFGGKGYRFVANYYGGSGNDLVLHWAANRAMAWSYNFDGQLGNGSSSSASTPLAVSTAGALAGKLPRLEAGCGRSARPVRREERGESPVPTSIVVRAFCPEPKRCLCKNPQWQDPGTGGSGRRPWLFTKSLQFSAWFTYGLNNGGALWRRTPTPTNHETNHPIAAASHPLRHHGGGR